MGYVTLVAESSLIPTIMPPLAKAYQLELLTKSALVNNKPNR
jgi:hypothetical protein